MKVYVVIYSPSFDENYGVALFIKGIYSTYEAAEAACDECEGYIEEITVDHNYDTCKDVDHYVLYDGESGNIKYIGGYIE